MGKDDNTLLWVALGAAIVYFLMRQQPKTATMPRLPAPRATGTPGVIQNADGSLTVTEPPLPEVNVPAVYPGGNVPIPGENASSLVLDPFFGINPGQQMDWNN